MNNPASAKGFTVIFNKARDEKQTGGHSGATPTQTRNDGGDLQHDDAYQDQPKSVFFSSYFSPDCFLFGQLCF